MKKIKIISFLILFIFNNISAQDMWKFNDYGVDFVAELSLDSIKNIIVTKNVDDALNYYFAAAGYLFKYHLSTEKQFLLDNLNSRLDTSLNSDTNKGYEKLCQWEQYYTDKYFLGLLGNRENAIQGMDSVARYGYKRDVAIANLAEAGIFDFYSIVKEEFINENMVYFDTFGRYGNDSRYKDEVRNIANSKAQAETTFRGFHKYANCIAYFEDSYYLNMLNDRFENTFNDEIYEFSRYLDIIDNERTLERTKYILQNIDNYTLSGSILPGVGSIQMGYHSKKLLFPSFINYLTELNYSEGSIGDNERDYFIDTFEPALPDSIVEKSAMLDTLTSYTYQSFGYEWLKDEPYKSELLTKLTNAKTKLTVGDSLGCRTEIASFQNSVNQVYQDSAGSYPKYVSDAGYKFMYHYAQYILDRLPETPTVEGLPVKLQNSQGNLLQEGTLQYYDSGWQNAIDNGNGTFTVQTERTRVSLKCSMPEAANK